MNKEKLYYKNMRPEILPFLPDSYSRVLEIGCGEGEFRNNLQNQCEYWGIEPMLNIAKTAKRNLDKVLTGTFDEVYNQLPDNYFDLVICNDVIEHMPDHDLFLQSIQKKMTINGHIVGSIPNVRHIRNLIELLLKRDWQYKESGVLDKTHLRFFTEKSLKKTLIKSGFVIKKFHGINNYLNKQISIDGIYHWIKYFPIISVLGQDSKYLQFGICIQPKNSTNTPKKH